MTDRQLNTLVDSIIGDNSFVVNVLDERRGDIVTQDGDWVAAYNGNINFYLWPEFVKSNGVYDILSEVHKKELLYGLYRRIAPIIKEYIADPSILDNLEYCCKLIGGYLFMNDKPKYETLI